MYVLLYSLPAHACMQAPEYAKVKFVSVFTRWRRLVASYLDSLHGRNVVRKLELVYNQVVMA